MSAIVLSNEPQPELGPAMRALHPRWQKAVTALFLTKGNRSAALRAAGYKAQRNSLHVLASRIFADDRVRAAVREVALQMIDVAEPELLATTLEVFCVAWAALAVAILWWPHYPASFQQRWVALPPAMSLQTFDAARKAANRPSFCQWDYPGTACRLS